jgi:hypothetical protein
LLCGVNHYPGLRDGDRAMLGCARNRGITVQAFAIGLALFFALATSALADGPLYNTPVFDPETGNYYALIDVHDRQESQFHTGYVWPEAERDARRTTFKGVRGRLAVVSSLHIHEFLELTFRPNTYAWIGLRYICAQHELEDDEGHNLNGTPFRAWARWWRQDPFICNVNQYTHHFDPGDFMPVAYSPIDKGFRWVGKGRNKGYDAYFIEYPTGSP